MGRAYYNEFDKYAAAWLRNLIAAGHIAPGDVDERDIREVSPGDLAGYAQCHFFAGIGVWSYALRRAGWPDDRPVWTGSCPCQPFSQAGQGSGFSDERHLWPYFADLIRQCKPASVFGEQVANKDALPWLDLVQTDLETMDYAFAAVPFPSAGVGAPHIRDRLFWLADASGERVRDAQSARVTGAAPGIGGEAGQQRLWSDTVPGGAIAGGLADTDRYGRIALPESGIHADAKHHIEPRGNFIGLADTNSQSSGWWGIQRPGEGTRQGAWSARERSTGFCQTDPGIPGPVNGFWRDADWLYCRDGKWRPVEPGSFPLADGTAPGMGRMRAGRLRGYGNAINAEAARLFIECAMESKEQ